MNRLNSSKNSIDIIYDLLKINRNEIFKNIKIKKFENIKLKNIYFKYDKNKKLIFQKNLFVTSRQKILICGDSGKGKTTLLNIILGLSQMMVKLFLMTKKLNLIIVFGKTWRIYHRMFLF